MIGSVIDAQSNIKTFVGTGLEAGADEDDFHILKRRRDEVEKDVRHEERARKMAEVRKGAHSGVVKAFGKVPLPLSVGGGAKKAKVVTF
jgi:zinc finger CCHC domain-containing protein 9